MGLVTSATAKPRRLRCSTTSLDVVNPRLQVCLLCGGDSRRMGRDKALLPHPDGGVWLTAMVDQLLPLECPIQVVSRHQAHADQLAHCSQVRVLLEPPPRNGPLNALGRVLPSTPGQALLVLPVDMPRLRTDTLQELIMAWQTRPDRIAVAHDGKRFQPLLAVIPSGPPFQTALIEHLNAGQWRWFDWLDRLPLQAVRLPSDALLNANRPEDLAALKP